MSDDDTMLVRILKIMPGNMLGDYCECRAARSGARPGTRAVYAVCERACPVQIDGALVWRGRGARAGAAAGLAPSFSRGRRNRAAAAPHLACSSTGYECPSPWVADATSDPNDLYAVMGVDSRECAPSVPLQ